MGAHLTPTVSEHIVALEAEGVSMERSFALMQRKNRELSPVAEVFALFLLQEGRS